ncbi:ASKHA domain-containing protein [Clostridium hydrogeniformans]|uniref:ASKHA domain-containing protein n=1 Tax=Clostridium hydrogeniformans TaxID=349933 RepID=UPI00048631FF|nr:ASKHA domain-containing protein [Clostridium hydrogeniformans]
MYKVYFSQYDKEIEVENNRLLIDVIRENDFKLETPCNSKGLCGKCKVRVYGLKSEPKEEERKFLKNNNERLTCVTRINEDIKVEFLIDENKALKTINEGYSLEVEVNSRVHIKSFKEIDLSDIKSYMDSLNLKVKNMEVIKALGNICKNHKDNFYGIVFEDTIIELVKEKKDILGLALDIGTTGMSLYLLDLKTGKVIKKTSALNPQTVFGGDVISRISFAMEEEDGVYKLQKTIIDKINELIGELLMDNLSNNDIYSMVVSANTTMLHMLLGVNPTSIAKSPYKAVFLDSLDLSPEELNIKINPNGVVTILPSISAYLGADITSGLVAIDIENYKSVLFIDIGTNGEIVLLKDGKLFATSTAAGPALEGMNISCGMRAENGAIEEFSIDENFNFSYSTIGDVEPRGICGSGLLDITSALINFGIIEPSGRFSKNIREELSSRVRDKKFYITDEIYISQKDIRQIQLAKGAIASGINMLLKELDSNIEGIDQVIIAGSFGYHLKEESIRTVGIIPKGFKGGMKFVGNSSVEGARIALLNREKFLEILEIKNRVEVVDLSSKDYFQKYFVEALNFN